jgi:D-alanyl-D-alanine carboxypeptidase
MNRPSLAAHAVAIATLVAACSSPGGTPLPFTGAPSTAAPASAAPTSRPTSAPTPAPLFQTTPFTHVNPDPVSSQAAARLRDALAGMAGSGGMAATVMSADGTWSGAAGKADGVHDLVAESQFGIASVTKSIVAAQVMQLVESGEVDLDVPATTYLPAGFTFDTNGATIRQLLSMRSGIPDWYGDAIEQAMAADRGHSWTTDEVLALVPKVRSAAGAAFSYGDTNYTLLGLVIEHVRKRPLADVLRDGVLDVEGTDRLVYQPDEAPSEPMAMPDGEGPAALEQGVGYLPSLSDASSAGPAGSIASDSISLARWWRAFCGGEVVSQASLTEMSSFYDGADGYGLGLFNVADPWANGIGHAGSNFGYVSWAGCLTDSGMVMTVLANQAVDDIGGMAEPLLRAARPS